MANEESSKIVQDQIRKSSFARVRIDEVLKAPENFNAIISEHLRIAVRAFYHILKQAGLQELEAPSEQKNFSVRFLIFSQESPKIVRFAKSTDNMTDTYIVS